MPRRPGKNPFYLLVMIVGTLFVLSACAYGTVMVRQMRSATAAVLVPQRAAEPFWVAWMDRNGTRLLLAELAVLAVLTVAAIGTDDYWEQRGQRDFPHSPTARSHPGEA